MILCFSSLNYDIGQILSNSGYLNEFLTAIVKHLFLEDKTER